jgi:hypothetical protein
MRPDTPRSSSSIEAELKRDFYFPQYRGIKSFGLRWFKSGARNHLPAKKPLEFRFEIVI